MTFLVVAILAEMLQKNIERKKEGLTPRFFRSILIAIIQTQQ